MRNEKGLTLVELLAVIVILSIIIIIAFTSIATVIKHARADTHLTNARNVIDVAKLAYSVDEHPQGELFEGINNYTLQNLADMGYLNDVLQSPSYFSWWEVDNSRYDMNESAIFVYEQENPTGFRVNLSVGGGNYLFEHPLSLEDIKRENLTREWKDQFNIK